MTNREQYIACGELVSVRPIKNNRFSHLKRLFFFTLLFFAISQSFARSPEYSLKASGAVYDFIVEDNLLYAATDAGIIDIFDIKKRIKINEIVILKIRDFMGIQIPPKVFSIDKIKGNPALLITVQGEGGFRDIFLFENNELKKIFDSKKDKYLAKRAAFINEDTIMLGLLSNELILYNFKTKKQLYRKQMSTSVFSDFTTDTTRKLTITCEESGKIRVLNSVMGKTIEVFSGQNVDNLYKVCYNKLTFIGAGQDRRVSVYKWGKDNYYMHADFLVYCVGLDNNGILGAYPANENNDIYVFNTNTREIKFKLIGQKSTLTKIEFLPNNKMISSSEDEHIMFWNLKN